jgi:hypothetical protein
MLKSCPTLMLIKDAPFILHYFGLNTDKLETCLDEIEMDLPYLFNIVVIILLYANMLSYLRFLSLGLISAHMTALSHQVKGNDLQV